MKLAWKCFMLSSGCFFTLFFINVFYTTQDVDAYYSYNQGYDRKWFNYTKAINVGPYQQSGGDLSPEARQSKPSNSSWWYVTRTDKNPLLLPETEPAESSPQLHMRNLSQGELFSPRKYNYTIANPGLCADVPVYILFFVQSAADHFEVRDGIRRTWASLIQYGPHHLRTVFMLADPKSEATQRRISHESEANMDVVQMGFVDHYRNLTLKHIMSLGWIATYCGHARYVVKADDDTLINIYKLIHFLMTEYGGDVITNHIYCSVYGNMSPRRDKADKWYVSKHEYPHNKYPPYCEGFAYVTSPSVANALYKAALDVPIYWIDDVYVTGIVLQKLGLGHRQFRRNNGYTITGPGSCLRNTVQNSLFQLQKYPHYTIDWDSCWRNITIASAWSRSLRKLRRTPRFSILTDVGQTVNNVEDS